MLVPTTTFPVSPPFQFPVHYSSIVSHNPSDSIHNSRASQFFSPISALERSTFASLTPRLAYKRCVIPETISGIAINIVEDCDYHTEYIVKSSRRPLDTEYAIQTSLEGRNITKAKWYFADGGKYHIVMEYCRGMDLFTYLQGKEIQQGDARKLFRQLVEAIETCHKAGVVHLDIKPENCFIDAHEILKLGDFGFAKVMSAGEQVQDYCGTLEYMSPEVHLKQPFDGFKADVFAAGKILFELALDFTPFKTATLCDRNFALFSKDPGLYWDTKRKHAEKCGVLAGWNPVLLDLLEKMMSLEAKARPTISEVKQHPWFTQD